MDAKTYAACCGIYCDLCGRRADVANTARALRDLLHKDEYDDGAHGLEGFTAFWRSLGARSIIVLRRRRPCTGWGSR